MSLYDQWFSSMYGGPGASSGKFRLDNQDKSTAAAGSTLVGVKPPMGTGGIGVGAGPADASNLDPYYAFTPTGTVNPPGAQRGPDDLSALQLASEIYAASGPNVSMPNIGGLLQTSPALPPDTTYGTAGVAPMNVIGQGGRIGLDSPLSQGPLQQIISDLFSSSQQPVNEWQLAQNIYDNPQLAIGMSGAATPGTPGYNNLANMGFDPYAVFLAQGNPAIGSTAVEYANWLGDLYNTMGTRADKGGGSIHAGPLLANLVNMPETSDLGKMMRDDPTVFYQMATQVMTAGGASPMAQKAFKSQIAELYQGYITYTVSVTDGSEILPINQWIKKYHGDVVQSWTGA